MINASLNLKLRPIRLGFLVDALDLQAIRTAIQINSFLWGGAFNPIIPVFRRLPRSIRNLDNTTAKSWLEGYLNAFDPDFVVKVGQLESTNLDLGHYTVLKASELLGRAESDGEPSIGIGLFDVIENFAHEELRFVRQTPIKCCMPIINDNYRLLFSAIFGVPPPQMETPLRRRLSELPNFSEQECTLTTFADFLAPDNLFLRRISSLYIKPQRGHLHKSGDCLFVLDGKSPTDILDYWNLRALGWTVIPVPTQALDYVTLKQISNQFVEENSWPYLHNPQIFNYTTLLKGRSVSEDILIAFKESLSLKPAKGEFPSKLVYQHWMPRIWNEWARDKDGAERCELVVQEKDVDLQGDDDTIRFSPIQSSLLKRYVGSTACTANDIRLHIYGSSGMHAEAIPEGGSKLAQSITGFTRVYSR